MIHGPGRRTSALVFFACIAVGASLLACGRTATSPPAPGSVRLELTYPAGMAGDPPIDSLFASVWSASVRIAGPVAAVPDSAGRFAIELSAAAGADRQVAVALRTDPGPNDPQGLARGIRWLGVSEPFALAAGGTQSVGLTFRPFAGGVVEVTSAGGWNVAMRFPAVPGAERYRLTVLDIDELGRFAIAETTLTGTALTWAIARPRGILSSRQVNVRPENRYAAGAYGPGALVPEAQAVDLSGVVRGESGPLPDVLVQLLGCPGDLDTGRETFTDAAGGYAFAGVPPGSYRVRLFRGGCTEQFDPPAAGACFSFAGIPVTRPAVQIECGSAEFWALCTLTWDERPRDLDLHLYTPRIPTQEDPAWEVYFGATGSATAPPFAELDADDTSGFGPENISIYRNFPGDYILAVENFCCSDTLSRSGARVRIVAAGGATSSLVLAAPATDTREWWIVARISGSTGAVTAIDTLSDRPPIIGLEAPGFGLATAGPGLRKERG